MYVCRAYTIPESFPMGLINSLHHHHHRKGTLLVTVAEFYVHALAPIANFFMAFETSDCNDFFLFALQTRIRFSAMFVVNWHFLFLFFFRSSCFGSRKKAIPSAGTRKNYSETHFKLSECGSIEIRKHTECIYSNECIDKVVYKRIDFCVRFFFLFCRRRFYACTFYCRCYLFYLIIYFVIFIRNYAPNAFLFFFFFYRF